MIKGCWSHCSVEAYGKHLSAVKRDREEIFQIEEDRIRTDAAFEEAKRKEKALQEEKAQQEKAKAEAEVTIVISYFFGSLHLFIIIKINCCWEYPGRCHLGYFLLPK